MACPLSVSEQQTELLSVVSLGMPRAEAQEKLTEAGIEFSGGLNESILYCDLWNRPDGERWHLNVALLFDPKGQLYGTRPGAAQIDAE